MEFSFQPGKIVITPKLIIDRSQFPTADSEYTAPQRRVVDARLDKSGKDFKAGRSYGPFDTPDEAVAFLRKEIKARKAKQKSRIMKGGLSNHAIEALTDAPATVQAGF